MKMILISALMLFVSQIALADVVPPEILSITFCELGENNLGKTVDTQGSLTRFKLPNDTIPGTPNLIINDLKNCPNQNSIVVDLSRCLKCECSTDFVSERIWHAIKELRNSQERKMAKVSLQGDLRKSNHKNYKYSLEVECIKEIIIE